MTIAGTVMESTWRAAVVGRGGGDPVRDRLESIAADGAAVANLLIRSNLSQ